MFSIAAASLIIALVSTCNQTHTRTHIFGPGCSAILPYLLYLLIELGFSETIWIFPVSHVVVSPHVVRQHQTSCYLVFTLVIDSTFKAGLKLKPAVAEEKKKRFRGDHVLHSHMGPARQETQFVSCLTVL